MRNFILGIVVVILLCGISALVIGGLGLMPTNADSSPTGVELRVATRLLDASIRRGAPRLSSPVHPSDDDLIAGMKIYTMNCGVCHGTLDNLPSPLEHSFYPPVPQLIVKPTDSPEWRTYFVVRNGIRFTGMPAWRHTLSDQDMWKVTAFLSQVRSLPPSVQDYWSRVYDVAPPGMARRDNRQQ